MYIVRETGLLFKQLVFLLLNFSDNLLFGFASSCGLRFASASPAIF